MAVIFDEVVTTIDAPATEASEEETAVPVDREEIHAGQFEKIMAEKQRRAKRLYAE